MNNNRHYIIKVKFATPVIDGKQTILFFALLNRRVNRSKKGLCIKLGRGQGDGDKGTRVWGLVTRGRGTRDLGTSSMGRGNVGHQIQGRGDVNEYCKNRR